VHHTNVSDAQADVRKLVCYDCGVACDLSAMRKERLVSLRKLGAEEPRPAPPPPAASRARSDVRRAPAAFQQGEARRYRFGYKKLGAAAFLSHLDLIRALPRAFRRADLPLFYSRGFHPKPDMTFGPALSLGVMSLSEVVDVKITADIDPASFVGALAAGAHEGLEIDGAARLGPQDAGCTRIIDSARYVVAFARAALPGGDAWLAERAAALLEASELPLVRRIDGIGKKVDVRPFLRGVRAGGERATRDVARAGLVGDLALLEVDVEIRGSGAVKISEVVEVLGGDLPFRAVRTEMGAWREDGTIVSPLAALH
jgi:radical SAM-linked protein